MPCTILEVDQSFVVQDWGPGGIVAPVQVNLSHGVKPGAVFSAVITTDVDMAINVRDINQNILLHVVSRVTRNDFALNSFLGNSWGPEEKVGVVPVVQGCRFCATLVYEAAGYRVFINGAEVAFYKHRSNAAPHMIEINGGQTFKGSCYHTVRNIVHLGKR